MSLSDKHLPALPDYKNPCWLESLPETFRYRDSYFSLCKRQAEEGKYDRVAVGTERMDHVIKKRRQEGKAESNQRLDASQLSFAHY